MSGWWLQCCPTVVVVFQALLEMQPGVVVGWFEWKQVGSVVEEAAVSPGESDDRGYLPSCRVDQEGVGSPVEIKMVGVGRSVGEGGVVSLYVQRVAVDVFVNGGSVSDVPDQLDPGEPSCRSFAGESTSAVRTGKPLNAS